MIEMILSNSDMCFRLLSFFIMGLANCLSPNRYLSIFILLFGMVFICTSFVSGVNT